MWALPIKAVASSVPNAEVLALGTPKKKKKKGHHEVCQMPNSFSICYNRMLCLEWYRRNAISFLFIFLSFLKQNISYFLHLDHMFTLIDSLVFSSFLLWATSWPISSLLSHKFQHHWSLSSLYSNLIIKTIYDSIWVISKQSVRVSS